MASLGTRNLYSVHECVPRHTHTPLPSLHDLSTLMCTSEPLVPGVYPEFRLLPLWPCSSQRAPEVRLMLLLPSRGLPQTQLCACLLCLASSLFLLKCGIWNKILPEDVSAATKPNSTEG